MSGGKHEQPHIPQPTKEQLDEERRRRGEHVTPHQEGDGFGPGSTGGEGDGSGGSPGSGDTGNPGAGAPE